MGKWFLKTFRIFDSPDKDVPDKQVIEGVYDIGIANVFIEAHNKEIEQLQDELDKVKELYTNWIPVSERLPDVSVGPSNGCSKKVWIIFRNEYHIGYYTNFSGWRIRGVRFQKRINQKDVTHWMEPVILPEQEVKK